MGGRGRVEGPNLLVIDLRIGIDARAQYVCSLCFAAVILVGELVEGGSCSISKKTYT